MPNVNEITYMGNTNSPKLILNNLQDKLKSEKAYTYAYMPKVLLYAHCAKFI